MLNKSKGLSNDALEEFKKKLADLPVKQKTWHSNREAVSASKDLILHAVNEKKYSYQDIADMLAAEGSSISASTLASYLRAPKKNKTAAKKTRQSDIPPTKTVTEPNVDHQESDDQIQTAAKDALQQKLDELLGGLTEQDATGDDNGQSR